MEEREIRRHQNRLRMGGYGVIVFGVWEIIKIIITIIYSREDFFSSVNIYDEQERAIALISIAVMFVIIICIRLTVGLSAKAQSKGKKGTGYLFFAYIEMISSALSIITIILSFLSDPFQCTLSLIVELTNAYSLFEVISSALILKKNSLQKAG